MEHVRHPGSWITWMKFNLQLFPLFVVLQVGQDPSRWPQNGQWEQTQTNGSFLRRRQWRVSFLVAMWDEDSWSIPQINSVYNSVVCSFRNSLAQWHCAKTLQKANTTLRTVLHSPGQCLGCQCQLGEDTFAITKLALKQMQPQICGWWFLP